MSAPGPITDALRLEADRIFAAALDLPEEQQAEYVAQACGEDAVLKALVDELLAAAGGDETLLFPGSSGGDGALWHGLVEELARQEAVPRGTVVDRYRILRELGRGGMAVVYLAERADGQFEHEVALKRLLRGIETEDQVQRFERERRILALVHHPHIAQLLDGGVDSEGRPYFAMEYVDGLPIDRYCNEKQLSVEERLELFLQVARAVEYAHRHLVVHRDLKPSNILVTEDGHAKLLDFGIAKLQDPEGTDAGGLAALALTRSQERPMTPVFASPEQVRGEAVTTASDVYQLGLLLYLLLSGRWPYRMTGGAGDWMRAICEEEPAPPSAAVARAGHQPPSAATRTGTQTTALPRDESGEAVPKAVRPALWRRRSGSSGTTRLRRQLTGDLDTIVLTTLRKEPERRYRSVARLIDDLESYLAGRPITARPDTFFYRAGKLVQRHRAATATAAAALVLLIALAVFYTVRLAAERDRARQAAAEATQVSSFLRGLFEISAPTRSKGEQVTARELLDRGARQIREELAGQPAVQAEMMTLMGDVYRELALYEEATPLLEEAVTLRRDLPEAEARRLADSLHTLGRVREEAGDAEAARALYTEALGRREALLGPEHPDVGRTLGGLGRALELAGDFEGARAYLERALAILEAALGPDDPAVGRALEDLGRVLARVREFEPARTLLERALSILESSYEADHPHVADARVHLAECLRFTGDPEGARRQFEIAMPRLEQAYGPDHPIVAAALTRFGHLLNALDDEDGAANCHRRALEIRRKAFGDQHPQVASSLNNLGYVESRRDHAQEARQLLEESIAIYEATLGPDHPDLDRPLRNLALIFQDGGQPARAIELYEKVLRLREAVHGPEHSLLNPPLYNLGTLRLQLGDPAAAEPLLRRALALGRDQLPHRLPEILWPKVDLGRCLTALGRYQEAEDLLQAVLADPDLDEPTRERCQPALDALYEAWGKGR